MSRTYVLTLLLACVACNNNPITADPEGRTGGVGLIINCAPSGADPLICTAQTSCSLYPCPELPNPSPGARNDVTALATWTSGDPSVVILTGPGRVHATGNGDTIVSAAWVPNPPPGSAPLVSFPRSISVFPNTPPLPTFEIDGVVYQSGMTAMTGGISGAVVTILDGLVAGRTAITGVPPTPRPGYPPLAGILPYYYRFLGIPPGVYTLRVTKGGYASQSQVATVTADGGPIANFALGS